MYLNIKEIAVYIFLISMLNLFISFSKAIFMDLLLFLKTIELPFIA